MLAVLLAAGLLGFAMIARRKAMQRLATANLIGRFQKAIGPTHRGWRSILLLTAMTMLVLGLLDPRMGVRYEQVAQRNIDVIFALDASRSMLAEDLHPNRLQRAKQYIEDVIGQAVGDRFGLVVFGGVPTLKVPLTRDLTSMRLALEDVGPQMGRRGGSMIGDAIRVSADALSAAEEGPKVIILLSDGEDMGSYPAEAAASAAESDISIWAVGLGDAVDGGRIPIEVNGERLFLTHEGQEVWSTLDAELMQTIATESGGLYIPAGTQNLDLADIYEKRIAPAAGKRIESARVAQGIARYRWFVGAALLMLAIECVLGLRGRSHNKASRPAAVATTIRGGLTA